MPDVLFRSWPRILEVLVAVVVAYLGLVLLLRMSGKRTTSKLNAFDWVVTVAMGSMLATVILSDTVALAEGLAAFAALIAMQYGIAWISIRSRRFRRLIKAEPTLLYYEGEFLHERMRSERISEEEIRAAVRESGLGSLASVLAVVLESNAELSVVTDSHPDPDVSTLQQVDLP